MNKEEIENYISELESMFELSELEEHSRNILKVGIYIKQLQQQNKKYKEVINKLKEYMNTLCDEYANDNYDIKYEVFNKIYYEILGDSNE